MPVVALILAAVIGLSVGGADRRPVPLHGTLLRGDTGLRLVVSDNPPFVLDVDSRGAGLVARRRGKRDARG